MWIQIVERSQNLDLKDFRPISLMVTLNKLLAKALANRFKKGVGKVVATSLNVLLLLL